MTQNVETTQAQYQPGDIVNGHQLSPEGQWVPVTATTTAPPTAQQPSEEKQGLSRTKKILIGAGAALAVVVVFSATAGGGEGSEDTGSGSVATQEADAGVGDAVRDGNFEFTVDGLESLGSSVGDQYFGETAQGEYIGVTVTVTNIGDEAQAWFDDNQTLIIDGKEYNADSMATILINDEGFYEEVNPGNSMTITLVYDVPTGSSPSAIELHDSAFSGGVTVQL